MIGKSEGEQVLGLLCPVELREWFLVSVLDAGSHL